MPKSEKKSEPQKEETAVRTAFFQYKGTIITVVGSIVVALIGLAAGKWNEKPPTGEKLIVKVVDKNHGKPIGNAKVSLEASGVSAVNSTDSEGVISFPIADPKKELRLRVEAAGYENFNLRVTPADIVGAQEIALTPVVVPSPISTPASSPTQPTSAPPINASSIVRGQVVDESGAVVPGARVTVTGYGSAVTTNESGNFQISLPVGKGAKIDLHVVKDGFKTRTQYHIINNDSVRIMLRR
jgi:hypothetical protein